MAVLMTIFAGIVLHAIVFCLILVFSDMAWYWAALISGLAVWLGILVFTEDMLS